MNYTKETSEALSKAFSYAEEHRHQYITPEHIVYGICNIKNFEKIFSEFGGDIDKLKALLPEGHLLREETIQEILCGDATLVIDWNEDGSIKDWGIL